MSLKLKGNIFLSKYWNSISFAVEFNWFEEEYGTLKFHTNQRQKQSYEML